MKLDWQSKKYITNLILESTPVQTWRGFPLFFNLQYQTKGNKPLYFLPFDSFITTAYVPSCNNGVDQDIH